MTHLFESCAETRTPDPNSALLWFPPVAEAGLPVPRTEFVQYDPSSLWPLLDGQPMNGFPLGELRNACERIGYPAFLRTDLASAKHYGPKAFRVARPDRLEECIFRTFEDNCLKDLSGGTQAFMVREYLSIDSMFTAFGGLPIGREWRVFADQDGGRCHHFYWPEDAFSYERNLPATWQADLAIAATSLDEERRASLYDMAHRAVRAIGYSAWSVDFALDTSGKWWLIDMATAARSWHPDCRRCA
jgi:hypothetical protein